MTPEEERAVLAVLAEVKNHQEVTIRLLEMCEALTIRVEALERRCGVRSPDLEARVRAAVKAAQ